VSDILLFVLVSDYQSLIKMQINAKASSFVTYTKNKSYNVLHILNSVHFLMDTEVQSAGCCGSSSEKKKIDVANLGAVVEKGWMEKRGEGVFGSAFKKRWFLMFQDRVLYFKNECAQASEGTPQGAIKLRGAEVTTVEAKPGQTNRFEIKVLDKSKQRTFTLACSSVDDQRRWHESLKKVAASAV
jgi:hypothetical protein